MTPSKKRLVYSLKYYDYKKISRSNYLSYFYCTLVIYSCISCSNYFLSWINYLYAIPCSLIVTSMLIVNKMNKFYFWSLFTRNRHKSKERSSFSFPLEIKLFDHFHKVKDFFPFWFHCLLNRALIFLRFLPYDETEGKTEHDPSG